METLDPGPEFTQEEPAAPTAKEIDQLITALHEKRSEKNRHQIVEKQINSDLAKLEVQIMDALVKSGLKKFSGTKGDVNLIHDSTVKVPKDPEQKGKLFDYMKERNVFEELITVNHQTLNAFYKTEEALAVARGDIGWSLPGVEQGANRESLRFKAKGE